MTDRQKLWFSIVAFIFVIVLSNITSYDMGKTNADSYYAEKNQEQSIVMLRSTANENTKFITGKKEIIEAFRDGYDQGFEEARRTGRPCTNEVDPSQWKGCKNITIFDNVASTPDIFDKRIYPKSAEVVIKK